MRKDVDGRGQRSEDDENIRREIFILFAIQWLRSERTFL